MLLQINKKELVEYNGKFPKLRWAIILLINISMFIFAYYTTTIIADFIINCFEDSFYQISIMLTRFIIYVLIAFIVFEILYFICNFFIFPLILFLRKKAR